MARWTDPLLKLSKEYQARRQGKAEPKPNKYRAVRTPSGFPSGLEERVHADLLYMQKAGLITDVRRYPSVHLGGKLRWKCDFVVHDFKLGADVWVEAKGFADGRFTAIKQVWPALGPGLLRIYTDAGGGRLKVEEVSGKS